MDRHPVPHQDFINYRDLVNTMHYPDSIHVTYVREKLHDGGRQPPAKPRNHALHDQREVVATSVCTGTLCNPSRGC